MDYDFISNLQKSLDDVYQVRFGAMLNSKDYGDIREAQGFIKAIKVFGDLIATANDTARGTKQ